MAFGGLYDCAKFGWNRHSSFDNMQILIFCEFGMKTPIHDPKMGVFGGCDPLNGRLSHRDPPKGTNGCRNTSYEPLSAKIAQKM